MLGLRHQLHQEILRPPQQPGQRERALVGVAANRHRVADRLGQQPHGFEHDGNPAVALRIDRLEFVHLGQAADRRRGDVAGLARGSVAAGAHRLGEQGGVEINQEAIVRVPFQGVEMGASRGGGLRQAVLERDAGFAGRQHEVVQTHRHPVGNPARHHGLDALERGHAVECRVPNAERRMKARIRERASSTCLDRERGR